MYNVSDGFLELIYRQKYPIKMSALERQALKTKLGGLPPLPPHGLGLGLNKTSGIVYMV